MSLNTLILPESSKIESDYKGRKKYKDLFKVNIVQEITGRSDVVITTTINKDHILTFKQGMVNLLGTIKKRLRN